MILYQHQADGLKAVKDLDHVAFYWDMGLGKTFAGSEKMLILGATVNLIVCQKSKVQDWVIVKIYTDAGHSGANTDRPALQNMIEDLKAGKIDKVLVYKLDRLSRSQKDTLELIEDVFLPNNTDFESMTEKLDTSTPQGRLFLGILAAFAQLEREMIKERMSLGMHARMKEGKWRGGAQVPFGYDYEPALEKLVINEYEAMVVQQLFERFTSGQTLYSLTKEMIEQGLTFHDGKISNRTSKYVLRNKTYCGYLRHKDEWLPALHDPIIDEETFEKAQAILDENQRKFIEAGFKTGSKSFTTNLGGLIYCARCGAKYSKVQSGTKKYGLHYNYACHSRHKKIRSMIKDPNCKNKNYRVDDLDNIMFNEIKKLAIDPEYINQIKKQAEKDDDVQKIHAIEKQIKSINAQISRFMDLYGLGKYDMDELDAKTAPLNEQRTKLKMELEKLQENSKRITEPEVQKLVESFDNALDHGDLHDRRFILEQLIDKIIIDGDDITIHWNFI